MNKSIENRLPVEEEKNVTMHINPYSAVCLFRRTTMFTKLTYCICIALVVASLGGAAKADLIDGSIGELSPFHETFGYYAHGLGPETAALPAGSVPSSVSIAVISS